MPEHASEIIKLPEPKYNSTTSVEEALLKRRSTGERRLNGLKNGICPLFSILFIG
jgi:hypothetical protein